MKPHIKKHGGMWAVFRSRQSAWLHALPVSCWPALDVAWLRFKEYTS